MPDKRRHRGAHPDDPVLFGEDSLPALRRAVADYAWLLSHGYAEDSSLKLVGDRHGLTARQRMAVWRSSCSDQALERRWHTRCRWSDCQGEAVAIDGYNLLITLESALSGGVILIGRDGCCRDLAGVHGTYRKVEETRPALGLLINRLSDPGPSSVDFYIDRPVSNSGRLKSLLAEILEVKGVHWNIEVVDSPDKVLAERSAIVLTSDGGVLDRCHRWADITGPILEDAVTSAWTVDLRTVSANDSVP